MKKYLFGGFGTGNAAGDAGLAVLRIITGFLMIFLHGWKKLQDPDKFIANVAETQIPILSLTMPIPNVLGWAAILSETVFAFFIMLGLATRVSAFFLLSTMLTAVLIVHAADPMAKKELGLIYAGICLLLLIIGAGRFSVDRLISGTR